MKKIAEKISLLGLSLMLISSFSISSALPQMLVYYKGYPADQVEFLVSIPSFFVVVMLLANGYLVRRLSERQLIVTGLLCVSLAGSFPLFVQAYWLVLLSRAVLGMGLGMINAKAISIISERYSGKERVQMLGLRGSAEVVGGAVFTLAVGQLLRLSWSWSFAIYAFGLVILLAYLVCVPQGPGQTDKHLAQSSQKTPLSLMQWGKVIWLAIISSWTVAISSVLNLRIPFLVSQSGMGTATQASYVLTAQQLTGIVSGMCFAFLLSRLKRHLLLVSCFGLAIALFMMTQVTSLGLLALSDVAVGFFYSIVLTAIFNQLSETIPFAQLNTATAVVLVGCNLGSALSPYLLKAIAMVWDSPKAFLVVLASVCVFIGLVLVFQNTKKEVTHAS
ncbi:MFS transporter [Streptococcus sp. DD12]|uniref:MFS transporter n=1 Tax=Streptococcus sp. DD12 TaxID=1777880 RepID=UPI0007964F32|nr:MFS transporter [Streptococcus sp. DD12]KXT76612.1 Major facilitator superfamily transporter-permease [Streptococcus sp. DD12]